MIRIKSIEPMDNYQLQIAFDDGREGVYDMNEDIDTLPGYGALRDIPGLFRNVQLDESRTCIYWNDYIDLPSDTLYEYGREKVGA